MSYIINFTEESAFPLAKENFVRMCGFKSGSEKHENMYAAAAEIRENGVSAINIRALVSEFGADIICEKGLLAGGVELHCDAVFLIEKEKVRNVLFYVITVEECSCESEQILDRIYADFWGTAYVDAAFALLRAKLASRFSGGLVLSEAFGPGYYGMPSEEIKTIFQILDGGEIGVKCLPSNVMLPIKSCAGLLFVMEKDAKTPGKQCRDCLGTRSGCRYCGIWQNIEKK